MDFPLIENTFDGEEITAAIDVLQSNKITMGPRVSQFEKEFAEYVGSKYAVMVNSGSSANLLAFAVITNLLNKARLPEGSEVLIPAVCWSTTYSPVVQLGNLKPVFVDVDPTTLNIDFEDMERKTTENTRAIIVVHVMGNCIDMDRLLKFTEKHKLFLIEDTCEAMGSKFKGKYLGTFGDFGTYSFYYSHHITTFEGGMIVTNDYEQYNLALCLRAHGWSRHLVNREEVETAHSDIDPRFLFVNYGFNLRPLDIQGAVGSVQLKKLSSKNTNRNVNYQNIRTVLEPCGHFEFCRIVDGADPAWFSMCIFLKDTATNVRKYTQYLTANGVENRPVISGNMVRQPVIQQLCPDLDPTDFPGAERVHRCGLLIGLSCEVLSVERIAKLVKIMVSPFEENSI